MLSVTLTIGFNAALEKWLFKLDDKPMLGNGIFWLMLFVILVIAVCTALALLFTVPAIAGGFGMLRRKRWARKVLLVSGAIAALDFPIGTALGVYTYWFLLGAGEKDNPVTERFDSHTSQSWMT